jgi:hypothetical protein
LSFGELMGIIKMKNKEGEEASWPVATWMDTEK